MSVQYQVLLIEDRMNDAFSIVHELERGGLEVCFERVETVAGVQSALEGKAWDLIICDHSLKEVDLMSVLAVYRQAGVDVPFVVVSDRIGEDHAVEVLKAGAHEFVLKENLARLVPAVTRELRAAQERRIRRHTDTTMAYLASVVQSCDDAIFGTTLDGTILSWNAGAERLYGYRASEVVGGPVSLLAFSYRLEEEDETRGKLSRGEHVEVFETEHVRKNGSNVEVSLALSPIKDGAGRVIGVSTVARDITRRRQEEDMRLGLIQDLTAALAAESGKIEPARAERGPGRS